MCGIEPTDLAGELPDLKIGRDAVDWYQKELDRYSELVSAADATTGESSPDSVTGPFQPNKDSLIKFSMAFLPGSGS